MGRSSKWKEDEKRFVLENYVASKKYTSIEELRLALNNTFDTNYTYYAVQHTITKLRASTPDVSVTNDTVERVVLPSDANNLGFEELAEFAETMKKTYTKTLDPDLAQNDVTIDFSNVNARYVGIAWMSDIHLGSNHVDYIKLKSDAKKILNTPNAYVYLGGDIIDNFIVKALASANEAAAANVQDQWLLALKFLEYMKPKTIAVADGNHTRWTRSVALVDILKIYNNNLNIVYTGSGAVLRLKTKYQPYNIFVAHKAWGMSKLNRHNAHKRVYDHLYDFVDVVVLEHYHETDSETFYKHGKKRIAINCGSYKGLDDYNYQVGAFHASVDVPLIIFDTQERHLIHFDNGLEDGLEYLEYLNKKHNTKQADSVSLVCKKHPKYTGKQPPRSDCDMCWAIYQLAHNLSTKEVNKMRKERTKK